MARGDLLVSLAKAGADGDQPMLEKTVQALVAEARAMQHHSLAERLSGVIHRNEGRRAPRSVAGGAVPERVRDLVVELPARRQLADLILPAHVQQAVADFLEEQQRADLLRASSLEPRHRILLAGPPGNGKTSLAEAIATALDRPFFVVRYDSVIGSYLGETASRLRRVFEFARTTPCVLFFDEFDSIGKERGDIHETGEIKRVVSSLLLQIDDLPTYTVVICATNHPELLDRAVWRRFEVRVELPQPGRAELIRWFQKWESSFDEPLGFSATTLARVVAGCSYAEVEQFLLDIKRKVVLSMGQIRLKEIVAAQINQWRRRYGPSNNTVEGHHGSGASTTSAEAD